MSLTDRELMQQAFEALEDMMKEFRGHDLPYGSKAYAKAKYARLDLYARLSKPEQKPVAVRLWDFQWVNVVNHDNCYRDWSKEDAINHAVKMTEKYIAGNVASNKLPPAQQETDNSDDLTIAYMAGVQRGKELAQRTWVGLTDEEIIKIFNAICNGKPFGIERILELHKAIEAKLKENT